MFWVPFENIFFHVSHAFKLINRSNRSMKKKPKKILDVEIYYESGNEKEIKKKYDTQLFEQ